MATSLRRGSTNQQIMQYYGPQIASMQAAGQPLPTELQTIAPQIEAIRQQEAAERAAQAERDRLWKIRSAEIDAEIAAEKARINALTVDEAQTIIADQIRNQKQLLEGQGVKWNAGISDEEVIQDMASRLARSGAKSIYDLATRQVPVDPDDPSNGAIKRVLYNTRTNKEVPPEYAFASMGDAGGTWGGTFAGPGSTRYEIQFVGGTPVFTAQQQATVKRGVEKLAGIAAPIALGFALGPAGLGLSSTAAGALAGGVGGLLKSGDIEDALKGAALGGVLGYGKEALFGAGTAASDLAQIEASMGTPSLLGSSNILDAINQAGIYTPDVLANISPEVAAANLGALESSLGTPSLPVTQLPTGVSPSDLAAIEASMGPGMQLPRVPNFQLAPKLEDIFSGFGDYNEAAQNLLGQAQQSYMPFADTSPTLGALINEPVRVPGDTRLVDTVAQPPLAVEDISGQLSPEAKRLMGMLDIAQPGPLLDLPAVGSEQLMPQDVLPDKPTLPDVRTAPDLVGYNEAVGQALADAQNKLIESGVTLGDLTGTAGNLDKGVLLGNEGYGPISDQTVTGAPITSSPITSLGPAANLNDVIDYLKGGAFVGSLGDAFKEAFKAATGSGQQQQGGGGLGGLGPIIGGLLSRSPTAAPSASVTPGRPVDIISPIQSLLAPKLVQQRPVTLL